jgi:hypothetical protein
MLSLAQAQKPNLIRVDEWVWAGVVGVHVVLGGLTWWMSRREGDGPAWMVVLAPSPAVLLSLCFVVGALPDNIGISLGLLSLLLFGLIWIALIVPLAYEMVRGRPVNDRFLSIRSLRLVALLNFFFLSVLRGPVQSLTRLAGLRPC